MKSLEELNAIKAKMQGIINLREENKAQDTVRVVVGMATCGIAAGARPVLQAFTEEVAKRNLHHVMVTQAGCLGMCKLEPMVEVKTPDGETTTYILMTAEKARRVVAEHLVNGHVVNEYTIGSVEK